MYKTGNYFLYKEHMNLRSDAKASSKILDVLPMGTYVEVVEIKDNWGKIQWNNKVGWCCISECFAKPVCVCENNGCCYYEKYLEIEKKYSELLQKIDKIGDIIK